MSGVRTVYDVNLLDVRLRVRSCGPVLIPEDIVRYPRIKIRTLVPSLASPLSPSLRVGCDASFCTRGSPNIVRALKVNARGALPRSYHLPSFPFPSSPVSRPPYSVQPPHRPLARVPKYSCKRAAELTN